MKKLIESSIFNKNLVLDIDEDILELALGIFIKNAQKEIEDVFQNFETKNFNQLKSVAHKLAGSSITVGLETFSSKAKKIELKNEKKITTKELEDLKKEYLLIVELAK